jgi:MFS family permease
VSGAVEVAPEAIPTSPPVPVGRGFQLILLAVVVTAVTYAKTAISPLQEAMRVALGLSDNEIALLQGPALALPVLLAAIPLGHLIDRTSRARLLLIFAVCNVLGSALTAVATSFAALFAARCVVGLTATATLTAAISLLADHYAPAQRGRATMIIAIGQIGGMSAAFALGGSLLATAAGQESWRWAMGWLASPLLGTVLLAIALREPPRHELAVSPLRTSSDPPIVPSGATGRSAIPPSGAVSGPAIEGSSTAFRQLWHHRALIAPLLIGVIMFAMAEQAVVIWAAPVLSRTFGLTPERIGTLMATGLIVSGLVSAVAGGLLADLCQKNGGPRLSLLVLSALAVLSIPAGLFAVMPTTVSAATSLILFITLGNIIGVAITPISTVVIPNELRGLFMSVLFATGAIFGLGLAPLTVSLLSGALGGPAMIGKALAVVCVTGSMLGAATFALGRRRF